MKTQKVPYLPLGWDLLYVPEDDEFMMEARKAAMVLSTDAGHPTGAVIVREGAILGRGGNRSLFHRYFGCIRNRLRKFFPVPSGKMYRVCYGCSPKFHAEQSAIRDVARNGHESKGADLYLWGHWWCCESCWDKMIDAGIGRVFLAKKGEALVRARCEKIKNSSST